MSTSEIPKTIALLRHLRSEFRDEMETYQGGSSYDFAAERVAEIDGALAELKGI